MLPQLQDLASCNVCNCMTTLLPSESLIRLISRGAIMLPVYTDDARRKEFSRFEIVGISESGSNFYDRLKARALKGLRASSIRSIYWKVSLRLLSPESTETWLSQARAWRDEYSALRKKFSVNPEAARDEHDLRLNNPLSTAKDYFKDNELSGTIKLDLSRTHPESDFFQQEDVQALMLSVLFIWAKLNPDISYRQGMNELLAPLVLVITREARPRSEADGADDLLSSLLDQSHVAADVFACFNAVMRVMAPYFAPKKQEAKDAKSPRGEGEEADSAIVSKCHDIHHNLLAQLDPPLYLHLERHAILPTVYALRWIRVLFSREFHIEDVMTLWDAIFAHNPPSEPLSPGKSFSLADHICIAMLLYVRTHLLDGDATFCMRRLLKYPPVEDVRVLSERAVQLQDPAFKATHLAAAPAPRPRAAEESLPEHRAHLASESSPVVASGGSSNSSGSGSGSGGLLASKKLDAFVGNLSKLNPFQKKQHASSSSSSSSSSGSSARGHAGAASIPSPSAHASELGRARTELAQLTQLTGEMGRVLEAVVDRMHQHYLKCDESGDAYDKDVVLQSIAELKHVKDVLIGRLGPDDVLAHLQRGSLAASQPLQAQSQHADGPGPALEEAPGAPLALPAAPGAESDAHSPSPSSLADSQSSGGNSAAPSSVPCGPSGPSLFDSTEDDLRLAPGPSAKARARPQEDPLKLLLDSADEDVLI